LNSTHPIHAENERILQMVVGQGAGEYTLDGAWPEENLPSGSQTPQGKMRQPAMDVALEKAHGQNCTHCGYRRNCDWVITYEKGPRSERY
jgi:hypothetical protein